jgi:hypothetical protein
MAYMVLVSFENEEEALSFADVLLEDPSNVHDASDGAFFRLCDPVVEGIYKKPTQFCQGCSTGKKSGLGFTKGQKFGWWVCVQCKKPSRLYWESVIDRQCSFGKNLLDRLFDRETQV